MALAEQHPLPSGFGAQTTAREALGERRLDGKTAIVTGGYAGIGLETTRVLAEAGAEVIVPARDLEKARKAIGGLANVNIEPLDLAVPASVDAFAARHAGRALHLLINNAGIGSRCVHGGTPLGLERAGDRPVTSRVCNVVRYNLTAALGCRGAAKLAEGCRADTRCHCCAFLRSRAQSKRS
jgi:NAD(P)-dependent dehydrogenase (short-subunit alcohol dehydrogenase family)